MFVLLAWLKDKLALDMEEELAARIIVGVGGKPGPGHWAGRWQGD